MPTENANLPPVYFNHLYIVLDDKTFRAVQGSDFLRIAFPGTERRATLTAAGETWSGTYYYCQDNYLEFFGSGNGPVTGMPGRGGHWLPGAQEGWAGLAFSTDQPGGAAAVKSAIQNAFNYEPFSELRQLQTRDKQINWFYNLKLAERLGLGSFDSWLMEYHPDIFAYKGITLPPNGQLTRQAYLSPWNQERGISKTSEPKEPGHAAARGADTRAPIAPRTPVFSRVIGATIHMDTRRADRFADLLQLLGYLRNSDGDAFTLSAHGFTLCIRPEDAAPDGYRLSSVRLQMARPSVAPMTFVFAPRSRLILGEDLTAEWIFGE